jgi:hypothetical protein
MPPKKHLPISATATPNPIASGILLTRATLSRPACIVVPRTPPPAAPLPIPSASPILQPSSFTLPLLSSSDSGQGT